MNDVDIEYQKICDKIDRVRIEAWVGRIFCLLKFRLKNYVSTVLITLGGSFAMNMRHIC